MEYKCTENEVTDENERKGETDAKKCDVGVNINMVILSSLLQGKKEWSEWTILCLFILEFDLAASYIPFPSFFYQLPWAC